MSCSRGSFDKWGMSASQGCGGAEARIKGLDPVGRKLPLKAVLFPILKVAPTGVLGRGSRLSIAKALVSAAPSSSGRLGLSLQAENGLVVTSIGAA